MKQSKKLLVLFLSMSLLLSSLYPSDISRAATLKLNKKNVTLVVGKSCTLQLVGTTKKVKWSSSNKSIANVNIKGKVLAKKEGKAKIICTFQKRKYVCKVTVKPARKKTEEPATTTETPDKENVQITLNPTALVMNSGETKAISAIVTPLSKQNSIQWSSENESVATISNGIVTAFSPGTTRIVAAIDNVNTYCTIQVNQTYGNISGNVTYFYNKYQGNKPDTGTMVYLFSKTGSGKNAPTTNSYVDWNIKSIMKDYEQYGIFTAEVDGSGNYTFNNIPTGEYYIFMKSSKTTSGSAFSDKEAYEKAIEKSVSSLINPENASNLGKMVGYQKYYSSSITVLPNQTVTFSYDFGTTYL